jgi:hypothetical protein
MVPRRFAASIGATNLRAGKLAPWGCDGRRRCRASKRSPHEAKRSPGWFDTKKDPAFRFAPCGLRSLMEDSVLSLSAFRRVVEDNFCRLFSTNRQTNIAQGPEIADPVQGGAWVWRGGHTGWFSRTP